MKSVLTYLCSDRLAVILNQHHLHGNESIWRLKGKKLKPTAEALGGKL